MFPEIDHITLNAAHSLMMPFTPEGVDLDKLTLGQSLEVDSFGLFETASPNYATFYPGVSAEDFTPKDEDFITPTFRMLSMTTVHPTRNPISFAKEGVLKSSMKKLLGQSINIDHETALGNAVGSVAKVFWQDSYETVHNGKKVTVPAGINAVLKIDAKSNPRIARGILMQPPSIHSNSVTVGFKWEKSHPEMEDGEFMDKLGSFDKKGRRIERVVNQVMFYTETSLVGHGADPFAQLINPNGEITNPSFAAIMSNSATPKEVKAFHNSCYDYKNCLLNNQFDMVSNSATPDGLKCKFNNSNKAFMKKQLMALAALFSITVSDEIAEDQFGSVLENVTTKATEALDSVSKLTAVQTERDNLQTSLTSKEAELTTLKTELEAAKAMKLVGEQALASAQNEAVRLYKVLTGDSAKADIVANLQSANYELANSYIQQYTSDLEEKLKGEKADGKSDTTTELSFEELVEKARELKRKSTKA